MTMLSGGVEATLLSVERLMFGGSVRMVFDRDLSVRDVGRFVFDGPAPSGVEVSIDMGEFGAFELSGVTFDVVRQMQEDVGLWVASAPEVVPTGGGTSDGGLPPGQVPVELTESELAEWAHAALEGTEAVGTVAEIAAFFAQHGSKLAAVAEVLGPIGHVATVILVGWHTVHAFGTGRRLMEQEGFCYGIVWEATETPDQVKVFWAPWADDSPDDMREAFYEGVAKGRAAAQEPKVRNAVVILAAHRIAQGTQRELAFRYVLEGLYEQINERGETATLPFPTPPDFPWRP